ncbi:hypothetical protein B0H11DRAFT_1917141 [Mycena galericulata]|nr:hypothetical protein B0H11DRAFT_1917141 [Mycena galericulata]
MAANSVAGLPLPLTLQFDFLAWRTVPADLAISDDFDIAARNAWNRSADGHNSGSIVSTKNYEAALQPGAPADATNGIDVGRPLLPRYPYTAEEKELLVESEYYCESVGPLPIDLLNYVVTTRLAKQKAAKALKEKKDKETEEKERNKVTPLLGSVVTKNPRFLSATTRVTPTTPTCFLMSLKQKKNLPLHWFNDSKLRLAMAQPHDIPLEKLTPETQINASTNPEKVHVVSVAKLIKNWGGDEDTTYLTPHSFGQSSKNLLIAWEALCGTGDNPPTIASNYRKHVEYVLGMEDYEEDFQIWYPTERRLRHEIFDDAQFVEETWTSRFGIAVNTHKAAMQIQNNLAKRPHDGESRPGPHKQQKQTEESFRKQADDSFRNKPTPTGPRNPGITPEREGPACLICAGEHRFGDHPDSDTRFLDGKPYHAEKKGHTLHAKGGVQGELCVIYNLNGRTKCDGRHGDARRHACSLCGRNHPALSRNPDCARVSDNKYRP